MTTTKSSNKTSNEATKVKDVNVKVIEDKAGLSAFIQSLANRGKKLQSDYHVAAVSVLVHVEKFGDIRIANTLIEAMPELARKNALKQWFISFGKLDYNEETKLLTYSKRKHTLLQDAKNNPFWKFKVESEFKPMDFYKALERIIAQAEKAIENGQTDIPVSVLNDIKKHQRIKESVS